MRDASIKVIRESGGDRRFEHSVCCESANGRMVVIEMNRGSRARRRWRQGHGLSDRQDRRQLAVGYTLDEIPTTSPGNACVFSPPSTTCSQDPQVAV